MTPPILVSLRPSRQLAYLLAAAHVLAAVAVLTLHAAAWLKTGLLALLIASAFHSLRRVGQMPVSALHLDPRGECAITTKVGARETAILLSETTLLPGLIVLALDIAGRRHPLVLLPDSAPVDDLRRLRVWLRYRAGKVSVSA